MEWMCIQTYLIISTWVGVGKCVVACVCPYCFRVCEDIYVGVHVCVILMCVYDCAYLL